jgi:hypothetical protein
LFAGFSEPSRYGLVTPESQTVFPVLRIVTATFAVLPATIVAGAEMLTTAALSYGDDGGGSSGGGTAFVPGGSWMSGVAGTPVCAWAVPKARTSISKTGNTGTNLRTQ